MEGGREGGREGGSEGAREGARKQGRERGSEGAREGGRTHSATVNDEESITSCSLADNVLTLGINVLETTSKYH